MRKTLYFAYGSNLTRAQMAKRCPTAAAVGPGVLEDYELAFRAGGQGVYLTVERCPGAQTPVGLWELGPQDEASLDEYEGFPWLYYRARLPVSYTRADTGKACRAEALVYIMYKKYPLAQPGQAYVEACLRGCEDFGLDTAPMLDAVARAGEKEEAAHE